MLFVAANARAQALEPYQLGYIHNPPFVYHRDQQPPRGILTDLLTALLERNGLRYEFNFFPPNRFFHHYITGDLSHIQLMSKRSFTNDENILFDDYSAIALQVRVFWLAGTKPIESIKELGNEKIVLVRGFLYGGTRAMLEQMQPSAAIVEVSSTEDAVKMLQLGRTSYILSYRGMPDHLIVDNVEKQLNYYQVLNNPLYITVHKSVEGADQLLQTLSFTLQQMKAAGEVEQLINQYVSEIKITVDSGTNQP